MNTLLIMVLVLLGATPTSAPAPAERAEVLRQALAHYDAALATSASDSQAREADFHAALSGFQRLADAGVRNGRLYYNIANTCVQLGRIGEAIANYRRALRLLPADPQIRQNLEFARSRVALQVAAPATSAALRTIFFWHYGTSLTGRTTALCVAYSALWLLLIAWRLRRPRRAPATMRWTIVTLALFSIAVGASVAYERWVQGRYANGVIVADDVAVRKGNSVHYDPQINRTLPAGVEFRLLETRPDTQGQAWYRIQLADGTEGWIQKKQSLLI